MPCTLLIKGGNIELHPSEKFTKVRQRIDQAKQHRIDYELGNTEVFGDGAKTQLIFFTDLGLDEDETMCGRIMVDVGEVIGVLSDEYKDGAGEGPLPEKPERGEEVEE